VAIEQVQTARIDYASPDRFVSLRRALGVTSFGLNEVALRPGQRGRIHRHLRQDEVYLVLRGTLTLVLEQHELDLEEGALAHVPAGIRRQLVNRSSSPCILVAIGAAGVHEGRDGEAFGDWTDSVGRPPSEVPLPEDLPN
jgi:uncharacterized cupin superfamily protein